MKQLKGLHYYCRRKPTPEEIKFGLGCYHYTYFAFDYQPGPLRKYIQQGKTRWTIIQLHDLPFDGGI